jgi:hypothetical protein
LDTPPPLAEAEAEKKRAQEEFMREQQARDRERLEARRKLCTFLRFWMVCPDRRCTRARQCAGDVKACFGLFWPVVPEGTKNEIRQAIMFMNEGMPPRQAAIEARAFVAQRKRIDDEMKAREAARRAEQPLPESEPAPVKIARTHAPARLIGPRVRGL